jgi:tRNA A-37 threonylcarbamoyl transferase component Bud32
MVAEAALCPRCGAQLHSEARFCSACGYSPIRLLPGQVLDGKYEILDKLAEGGMGQVYRARHIHLDEIRIIKVTKPDPIGEGAEPRRFQEEARIAALVRHPNVAALYDFSRLPDGSFYMVWEFIHGVTLEEWLRRNGAMPVARALEVAGGVLAGLSEIHAQGIVHRDLAPDNIMLREAPGGRLHAKIIDLGIAKRVAADSLPMTRTGMFVGKLKYCSPEQAGALERGERVDGRSDLYSFGVVLYEMLSGHPPFEAQTPEGYLGQHLHTAPPPLEISSLPRTVGPPLAAIVHRALEKNRNRRFADANQFREALGRLEPLAAAAEGEAASAVPPTRRAALWPTGAVAALLVLAAGVAALALVTRRAARPEIAPPVSPAETSIAASPQPTPAPTAGFGAPDATAPGAGRTGSIRSRSSSRTVDDPSEAGAAPTKPTVPPGAPGAVDESIEEPSELPAQMDGDAAPRFRKFFRNWWGLPRDRQASQAMSLARAANLFAATYPDDPLTGELRRRLPASLKEGAESELDAGRPRVAARFYAAYRALDFAARDPDLDRRFAELPSPGDHRRPPGR